MKTCRLIREGRRENEARKTTQKTRQKGERDRERRAKGENRFRQMQEKVEISTGQESNRCVERCKHEGETSIASIASEEN